MNFQSSISQGDNELSDFADLEGREDPVDEPEQPDWLMQVLAMFLKRWYSFKRDWRMWLITLLPSVLIFSLLILGF